MLPPSELLLLALLLLPTPQPTLANDPVLLFAQSSVFQFTVGASVPIAMGATGGLSASLGYQFNYALPSNLSQLEPTTVQARQPRSSSLHLSDLYLSLERTLERYGWGDARQCMLRTICELAEAPLHRRGDHVVEEIIHLLLTPSEDGASEEQEDQRPMRDEYERAELLGRSARGECGLAYDGCLGSPLDTFTELEAR